MSRHGTVLPIPADPRIARLIEQWPEFESFVPTFPRSQWLGHMEAILRDDLPGHSSRDYNLTARSLAPFPLRERDWL